MKTGEIRTYKWIEKDAPLPKGWKEVNSRWVHHHVWSRLVEKDIAPERRAGYTTSNTCKAAWSSNR